jgi:hypothetical protein
MLARPDTSTRCQFLVSFFTMMSSMSDTGICLLVSGRMVEGHPNTVVSDIFISNTSEK